MLLSSHLADTQLETVIGIVGIDYAISSLMISHALTQNRG